MDVVVCVSHAWVINSQREENEARSSFGEECEWTNNQRLLCWARSSETHFGKKSPALNYGVVVMLTTGTVPSRWFPWRSQVVNNTGNQVYLLHGRDTLNSHNYPVRLRSRREGVHWMGGGYDSKAITIISYGFVCVCVIWSVGRGRYQYCEVHRHTWRWRFAVANGRFCLFATLFSSRRSARCGSSLLQVGQFHHNNVSDFLHHEKIKIAHVSVQEISSSMPKIWSGEVDMRNRYSPSDLFPYRLNKWSFS